ncbi:methane monooxygenase PmoA-like [Arcticibacter tournemirensis]|uniref:PmoA family protein n=1 Tax=Arcticibacter tournemirensis TaxID=699437 RepID=A0A5M9GN59_9SPHI|nr:PmoA family protein [Arcticibacter tournemirensis]KAA8475187.1 hypothetical protein F1649_21730 [Arcticibacter tournemirensis]TQM52422.1 methane monooxygenase PmoA-like [Arcticibacter tournemirensis]
MKYTCYIVSSLLLATTYFKATAQTDKAGQAQSVKLVPSEKDKRVDVFIGGKPFTSYIYPDVLKKPVLYPVRSSTGTIITRGWPMDPRPGERIDHPHHVGIWFNYGDVNGYDFWNNSNDVRGHAGPFGTIRHQKVNKIVNGKEKGELYITADWLTDKNNALLKENTRFVFSGNNTTRVIDRITTLTALKESVLFKDNKEGLLAIRIARELEHPSDKPEKFTDAQGNVTDVPVLNNEGVTGHYLSSEGKEGDSVWGTRAGWVVLSGRIKEEPVSVMIIDHQKNPGFPSYWHARGYGLFAINSLGQNAMSNGKDSLNMRLAPGQSVTFRYRIIIKSGGHLSKSQATEESKAFSNK